MRTADKMERQRLIYRDEHLLVVNKPSGLLSHRGWAADRQTALSRARDMLGQRVFLPHRLDRATSGLLIFALDPQTHRDLCAAFERQEVRKSYLALVRGHTAAQGEINHPIRLPDGSGSREALSRFTLLDHCRIERCSLLRVQPHTGRPHQIRRHLKHISHPILGDTRYGKGDINRQYRERHALHRLALHAHTVAFTHPVTGETLELEAPLPTDLLTVFESLQLVA